MSDKVIGKKKRCCENPANLAPPVKLQEDLVMTMCRECGCRHFEARADPGSLGLKGAAL